MAEKRISVLSAHGQRPVAYLVRGDGIDVGRIEGEINGASTLTFSFSKRGEKYQYVKNVQSIYAADGREYTRLGLEKSLATVRGADNKITYTATAWETQNLLRGKYKNISNDTLTPNPTGNTVIIVSGGTNLSGGLYTVGSAAHALYALLSGTGWTLGACDVTGKYDLETEGKSVYENIEAAVGLWGGMLFWDSANRTVSWRAESTYQQFGGFQIRYGKNLKSLERNESTAIITRLYPYGENKLSIKTYKPTGSAAAHGKEYIDNFSYTTTVYEGQIQNNDIREQATLWNWAQEQHKKLCRPQVTYSASAIDLTEISNYNDFKPVLGQMADVIDDEVAEGTIDRKRIVKLSYDFFRPWDCDIEIGDSTGNFLNKFVDLLYSAKKTDSAINNLGEIHGGLLAENTLPEGSQFPELYRQVSDSAGNISTIIQRADSIETRVGDAEGNLSSLQQTSTSLQSQITSANGNISSIQQTVNSISSTVSSHTGSISSIVQTVNSISSTVSSHTGSISTITQTMNSLSVSISNNSGAIASINVKVNNMQSTITAQANSINFLTTNGVTFSDLTSNSNTKINGSYITTGTISANRISSTYISSYFNSTGSLDIYRSLNMLSNSELVFGTNTKLRIGAYSSTGATTRVFVGGVQLKLIAIQPMAGPAALVLGTY